MQKENSGSSQDKKQEDTKQMQNSGSGASPDVGGNEYTAAFILYCQKTLDNFRSVYGDMYSSEAALGSGSALGPVPGSSFSFGSGPSSSFGSEPEPESENDEFELEQDYPSGDKDKEALEELSEQFEQMLRAKAEFEDDDELDEDDKSQSDDYKEKEALRELSEQFEQMLRAKAEFEDNDELERGGGSESDDHQEKEALEEFFEQFEQMFNAKTDDDDDDELERGGGSESDDHQEKEALEEFFEQFEQMLKTEAEPGNNSLESEQDDTSQSKDHKGKEALKELLGQFEQMLNTEVEPDSDEFELEQGDRSQSNGYKEKEEEELLEQPGPVQKTARGAGAVSHGKDGSGSHGEEKASHNVTGPSSPSQGEGLNDAEIDEALSGVGEVVKSAKENLGIVEAFWEEPESQRAKLLTKAEITQEQFEQVVTRAGSHLYDVKDCLEGWGDLSMLPETYEQLLLANNELSEIFEKMYGKKRIEVQNKRKGPISEKEDDLELEDSVEVGDWALDDEDDWDFDDDDDEDDDE